MYQTVSHITYVICIKMLSYSSLLKMSLISYLVDWIIAEVLCLKQGGYGGRVHYFLKYGVLYVPMFGWYLATVSELIIRDIPFNDHIYRGGIFS